MDPDLVVDAMRTAARALRSGDTREQLHALQAVKDAIDAAQSVLLSSLESSKDFEIDGASTVNAWVRNQLHVDAGPAGVLVRNARALRDLPLVAEAALSGRIGAGHVQAFAFGIKHIGLDVMVATQAVLLEDALAHPPSYVFDVVKKLRDAIYPDDLDEAWKRGMDKQDFQVNPVPDGHHVSSFLGTVTGAKLKKVIDAMSAPRDKDDDRTAAERRVQAIDDLCESYLQSGLPADKGIRPHVSVYADADTVAAAAEQVRHETEHPFTPPPPRPDVTPATLAGYGPIGPHLLMYFMCVSDFTAFLMKEGADGRQAQILNVGRTRRHTTLRQRRAVLARQQGVCAAPGCHHTHLEIHHTVWWSEGGPTDLDLLVGLCTRCHHLLHRGGLTITGNATTGFVFRTKAGGRVRRRRRRTHYQRAA